MSYSATLPAATGLYGSGLGASAIGANGLYGAADYAAISPVLKQQNPLLVNPSSEVVVQKEFSINLWKLAPLLLLVFLLPALLVVAFLIPVLLVGLCGHFFFLFAWKKSFDDKKDDGGKKVYVVPYQPNNYPPYYPDDPYASGYGSDGERKKRSAGPVQTDSEVQELTTLVLSALRSQDCIQRLLCETVTLGGKLMDTTWTTSTANADESKPARETSAHCQRFKCKF